MCGIVGSWGGERIDEALLEDAVRRMRHRGPDGAGVFLDASSNLGFGHARLAIQDLSERGAQPMTSSSGRYTCVFNGEIYNHLDLRNELGRSGAPAFRGTSDTETLLAAIEAWGVKEAVGRLDGMFAIGVWDTKRGELHLIRDRLGLKPLYVGRVNGRLVFASDLASIHAFGAPPAVSFSALAAYFRYACVPGNECIYEGFTKVEAATFHSYRVRRSSRSKLPSNPPSRSGCSRMFRSGSF